MKPEIKEKVSIMIVPTGIGASIGGYAGDASRYAQKIAKHIPLIVNPHIVNAAVFSGISENMFYVEGWAIEQFVKGNISLLPSQNNKIGVIFDSAIPQNVLNIHLNTINAIKTVYDIDIIGHEITKEPAGVEFFTMESGISAGRLNNPEICFFEEPPEDDYENGDGVDIVGGVEAIISHYLTEKLMCPCVHAPAFEDVSITGRLVDPKVSAEYITPTFLPCLMFGLKNAPLLIDTKNCDMCYKPDDSGHYITCRDLHSVVVPHDALGSSVVLDSIEQGIKVFAVKENNTVLNVNKYAIGKQNDIIEVDSYEDYIKYLEE